MSESVFEQMKVAVRDGDETCASKLAQAAVDSGMNLGDVLNMGFLPGIKEAGVLYEAGDYFLPDIVCAADAMKSVLSILNLAERRTGELSQSKGVVLLATVQGDVHDIGKTIVGAMLTASGYEVTDLGADVKNEIIVDSVREMRPSVLGLSALLTTTIKEQRTVIELLEKEGLRSQLKIVVGGAPANSDWAENILADGYADTGIAAVRLVNRLLYGKEDA
ncbi:MAG: hypothetical protein CVU86_03930 [Firmicutes bacterium HGW-Firmicutes-11]|jgi:corrinoid protein of di/trimethylamine methyltransferase|nr:MAG: hypothetical protein CVU86_03930 [Firmicutes bacterium HGW-Firmicutes-11]